MTDSNIKHYIIECDPYVFGATITQDDYLQRYVIKFGGRKACVHFTIYDNIPNIDGIGYGKRCALNKSLEPGEGTEHLLKTAIRFIFKLFPNITKISLKDTSYRCNENETMSLGMLYIAKYGETWYSKKFGAKAENKKNVDDVIQIINNVLKSDKKPTFKKLKKQYLCKTKISEENIQNFETIYHQSSSLRDFIIKLSMEYDCGFLREWLPKLLTDIKPIVLENEEFMIKKSVVKKWTLPEITINQTDVSTFVTKTKPFLMNVMDGGKKKKIDPHLTQPLLYKYV
jgi:hypothetical protein